MADLLEVRSLKKYFKTPAGMLHAVDDVTFSIGEGKTLGVVGESGCGKSTLGRTILGLTEATEGTVTFQGTDVTHLKGSRWTELRRDMQIIFQDPFSSLNPRFCVSELIAEPLKVFQAVRDKKELDRTVEELMDTVGLARRLALSYPHELDGGRRQRIGIARALALNPSFVVCDEPVSALDVSIQAQVINLLQDLQRDLGLTYIFITHDMSVVRHISTEICVMYLGKIVEQCGAKELFRRSLHPYTQALLSAIPVPSLHRKREKILLQGELSSPIDPPDRCRFANRCPHCTEECLSRPAPELTDAGGGHLAACHRVKELSPV